MDLVGADVVNAGKRYVDKGIEKISFTKLRIFFDVNNEYVMKKMCLIIFPFIHKEWNKNIDPIVSPDLYIPIMSFITFILLHGLKLGIKNNFTPENLSLKFTKCLIIEFIETVLFKLIAYFFNINIHTLEYISFSGYKYLLMIIKMINVPYLSYFISFYCYFTFFFFFSRSMKSQFVVGLNRTQKVYFLLSIAFFQIILIYLISW